MEEEQSLLRPTEPLMLLLGEILRYVKIVGLQQPRCGGEMNWALPSAMPADYFSSFMDELGHLISRQTRSRAGIV